MEWIYNVRKTTSPKTLFLVWQECISCKQTIEKYSRGEEEQLGQRACRVPGQGSVSMHWLCVLQPASSWTREHRSQTGSQLRTALPLGLFSLRWWFHSFSLFSNPSSFPCVHPWLLTLFTLNENIEGTRWGKPHPDTKFHLYHRPLPCC